MPQAASGSLPESSRSAPRLLKSSWDCTRGVDEGGSGVGNERCAGVEDEHGCTHAHTACAGEGPLRRMLVGRAGVAWERSASASWRLCERAERRKSALSTTLVSPPRQNSVRTYAHTHAAPPHLRVRREQGHSQHGHVGGAEGVAQGALAGPHSVARDGAAWQRQMQQLHTCKFGVGGGGGRRREAMRRATMTGIIKCRMGQSPAVV
jgi:hypothetical protein